MVLRRDPARLLRGEEERDPGDVLGHQPPLQALALGAHRVGLGRQPQGLWRSVMIHPGEIALTRMLSGPWSRASERSSPIAADFAAA